jgi:hypothetical protein
MSELMDHLPRMAITDLCLVAPSHLDIVIFRCLIHVCAV